MPAFHVRRGLGRPSPPSAMLARTGQVYLDTRARLLYLLDDAARELRRQGVPLQPGDLVEAGLRHFDGEAVRPEQWPLWRAWQDKQTCEAAFLLPRPGQMAQALALTATPLLNTTGEVAAVFGTVTLHPPEPDWEELAGLAHDLRSPLQTVLNLAPFLETLRLPGPAGQTVALLHSAVSRGLGLGQQILRWCRGPTRRHHGNDATEWIALHPMLQTLIAELVPQATRKMLTLEAHLDPSRNLFVQADGLRLTRLVNNLLVNAIRYTSAGRVTLGVEWREAGRELILWVEDTGTGFSEEDKESIFQPYQRGRAGRADSDSGGSGLGLAVVDRLVFDLGLVLDVTSEEGQGSRFELLLPASIVRRDN